MSPKLALASILAITASLANGQTPGADSVRDSYHIFFPAMGKDILAAHIGAHSYKIVNVFDQPSEFYVDDKRVGENERTKYDAFFEKVRTSVKDDEEEREMREMARDRRQAQREREQADRERVQEKREREQEKRDRVEEQIQRVQEKRERQQEKAEREQEKRDRKVEKADRKVEQADRQSENDDRVRVSVEIADPGQADSDQGDWNDEQINMHRERSSQDRKMLRKGIQVLVDEHIIDNPRSLKAMVLTDAEVSVNGVRQPQNIYQEIRSKIGDWAHNGFSYDVSGDNYSISIND